MGYCAQKNTKYYKKPAYYDKTENLKLRQTNHPVLFHYFRLNQKDPQKAIFYKLLLPGLSNKRFRLWLASLAQSNLIRYVHPLDDFLYMKCVYYHE
jgi:hypothetical protein